MSIRSTTMISNTMIGASVALLLGFVIVTQWQELYSLKRADQSVQAVGQLSTATIELSLERSLTQVVLNLNEPIDPDIEAMLTQQRKLSKELFADAKNTLENSELITGRQAKVERLQDQLDQLGALRSVADKMFAVPIDERDKKLIKKVPEDIKSIVSAVHKLIANVRFGFAGTSKIIQDTDLAVNEAWTIREYGGRERTLFAIAAARREALSREALAYMHENNGKAIQAWSLLEPMIEDNDLSDELRAGIVDLGESYFQDYEVLRQDMFKTGWNGDYPVTFGELFERSEYALNKAVALVNIAVAANETAIEKAVTYAFTKLIVLGVFALTMSSVIVFAIWYSIVRVAKPLVEMAQVMGRMAENDLSFEIPNKDRTDEIGAIAKTTQVFKSQALEVKRLEEQQAEMERQSRETRKRETEKLADDFERTIGTVVQSVGDASSQLGENAQGLETSAQVTGEQVNVVSQTSQGMADNIGQIATATSELRHASELIAQQVGATTEASRLAVDCTTDADSRVNMLKERAESIGEIVSTIGNIAEQTNLLALNATIEAARAGEAGSGFAVVASEVKSLASQTAAATEDVFRQINEIQSSTSDTVSAILQIKDAITKVENSSSIAATTAQEQTVAIAEISRNVDDASRGSGEVTQSCDQLSQGATSTRHSAHEMVESAKGLKSQSDILHEKATGFLDQIRQSA